MLRERKSSGLPIIVGVTGHRDLRADDAPALAAAVDAIFDRLERDYPSTPLLVLTPLAEGADCLVAEVARRRAIPYRVAMPLPLESYRTDFTTASSRATFELLLAAADGAPYHIPLLPGNDDENVRDEMRRAQQYASLGAHLARVSHVLIALWDGLPSESIGGTAQIVRFRVLGAPKRYLSKSSVIDAPETGPVYHIYASRASAEPRRAVGFTSLRLRRERTRDGVCALPTNVQQADDQIDEMQLGAPDPFETLYRRIDAFNEDRAGIEGAATDAGAMSATRNLMHTAERLATHYQKKIVAALQRLFGATALAVLTLEAYAHLFPRAHPLVVVYFAASVVAVWTYAAARRGRWQDRAQDYRALEIGLNVQQAWDAAGLGYSVADYYIRRQRTELDWIREAIRTAHNVDRRNRYDEAEGIAVVRAFVAGQYAYFAGTPGVPGGAAREEKKSELHARISRWSLGISFIASALLVVYGLLAWLAPNALHAFSREELLHGWLIFAVASAAVAAVLFHDYPARRGHPQHARRYAVMIDIYARALAALDEAEQPEAWREPGSEARPTRIAVSRECIAEVGHETLIESGDWLLLHRELPIELLPVG